MYALVAILTVLFSCTPHIKTMHPQSNDYPATARKLIIDSLSTFKKEECTLDHLFATILPPEIIRKIVHYAYGNELYDFFIRSQGLELFNRSLDYAYNGRHVSLLHDATPAIFNSNKGDPAQFAFYRPNCVYHDKDLMIFGYKDGSFSAHSHHNDREFNFPSYLTERSPVTALTFIEPIDKNGNKKYLYFVGHHNGELLFIDPPHIQTHLILSLKDPIVSVIATHHALIAATHNHICFVYDYRNSESSKSHLIIEPQLKENESIVDIGYQGCHIFLKTSSGAHYGLIPYNSADYQKIMEGSLTPTQAEMIYQILDNKRFSPEMIVEKELMYQCINPLMSALLTDYIKARLKETV